MKTTCISILLSALLGAGTDCGAGDLAAAFQAPPASARMWTWWFWLGDLVDQASITADLEALKAQGMGGVTVYSISGPGVPGKGPDYMSPPWRTLFKHTLHEANRLGLGVSLVLCSGWNAGGPWINPQHACKRQTSAELTLTGPQHFTGKLPMPAGDPRFYQNIAVQAFPNTPAKPGPNFTASSSHPKYPLTNASDGNSNSFWVSNGENPNEGPNQNKPEWLRLDWETPQPVSNLTIVPRPGFGPREAQVQASTDGSTFTTVASPVMERDQATVVALPGTPVRAIRLWITATNSPQSENVQIVELGVNGDPLRRVNRQAQLAIKTVNDSFGDAIATPIHEVCAATLKPLLAADAAIPANAIIDLSAHCTKDGTLDWQVPDGQWTILRTGYTMTGSMTNWSSPTGLGLEADPLDPAAMDIQFANAAASLVEDAGNLTGKTWRSVQIDSWENKLPNWSAGFRDDFRRLRGYDPQPYLPVLAGRELVSAEVSDRFLYDYRKTVGDCVAEHYFGRLSQLAEAKGLVQQSEAGGVCVPKVMALDCLKNLGRCAIPMGEFWQDGLWVESNQNKNGKQTASAAHVYGKPVVAAEAFTSFQHWVDSPASLKPTADRAFCEGFNQFFIFSSATRSGEGLPGTEFCAGTHFNRKITWWNQSRCFNDYVARCSYLLQQGHFAADVLFYNGDGCPNMVSPKHIDPALGPGYDYDVCNSEVILTRLKIANGRIILPDGMNYRVLVLPERKDMPLEVLVKLKDLVAAGMTLVGPKPDKDPGLNDYPRRDQQLQTIAAELWGDCDGINVKEHAFGRGRVVWGTKVRDVLTRAGVQPDFVLSESQPGAFLDWIHRRVGDSDIYFIANRNNREEKATGTFRINAKQPELWNPVTGTIRDLSAYATTTDHRTAVPLELAPYESCFIVFRKPGSPPTGSNNFAPAAPRLELAGPWQVRFDPQWLYPLTGLEPLQAKGTFVFDTLEDWSKRKEPCLAFYSGMAVYQKTFNRPADPSKSSSKRWYLDLGVVKDIARVKLNGKDLGVVWCHPWRVDVTRVLQPGDNQLAIEVTNLWPNRLVGDSKLPADQRRTQTNVQVNSVLASGLLGPVRLMAEE